MLGWWHVWIIPCLWELSPLSFQLPANSLAKQQRGSPCTPVGEQNIASGSQLQISPVLVIVTILQVEGNGNGEAMDGSG